MSYLVLARKYRPGTFGEVVGQEHVTRTLRNAIVTERLGHAFLFSGLRGVGKTSVARILAKALNCMDKETIDEPCGKCLSCLEIDGSRSLDVVEMDAASHTGVDDVRELREAVMYAPGEGRYKVYIIDEVHMMSRNAFNALLKTLEEPPPRVIFILATTEPHKVPVTIHSRCQRYDFRRIPSVGIVGHLVRICEKEGVEISSDSLRRIAIAAEGSLRDSQSLLDQVLSYAGSKVSDDDVNMVLGSLDRDKLHGILTACVEEKPGDALRILGDMIDNGADPVRVALDLLEILRSLMILIEVEDTEGMLDLPEGEMEILRGTVASGDPAALRVQFALLARGEERMRRSTQPRFHLELALVHMARVREIVPLGESGGPVAGSGGGNRPGVKAAAVSKGKTSSEENPVPGPETSPPVTPAPAFAGIETPKETWEQFVQFVNGKMPSIGSMLEQLIPVKVASEELIIGGRKGELYLDMLQEREKLAELAALAKQFFNRDMLLKFKEMNSEERSKNSNVIEKRQQMESDLARKIKKEAREHPMVREAMEIFSGELKAVKVLGQGAGEASEVESKEEEL
ncbi:MAG: DNA polymerase III subunit gamma/tau [bacterium]|nr:DNA polymerase III subunit gamma/tau [bacterium]